MRNKTLSADTLFHFTPELEYLVSILENDFYPRFCIEDWSILSGGGSGLQNEIAIPMVCFCDIQLSQIQNHISVYGKYAIGLKKEWGIKNRITPLLYAHEQSFTSHYLKTIRKSYIDKQQADIDDNAFYPFVDLLKFCKPYEGRLYRKDGPKENVRFYDEREWRYFPSDRMRKRRESGKRDFEISIYKKKYKKDDGSVDRTILESANNDIKRFKLTFTPDDIKYIIISKENERLDIAEKIKKIQGSKFTWKSIQILTTKIISVEQILNDF